jgi:hypothetical protein
MTNAPTRRRTTANRPPIAPRLPGTGGLVAPRDNDVQIFVALQQKLH